MDGERDGESEGGREGGRRDQGQSDEKAERATPALSHNIWRETMCEEATRRDLMPQRPPTRRHLATFPNREQ